MVARVPKNAVASIAVRRAMEKCVAKVRVEEAAVAVETCPRTSDCSAHVITVLPIGIAGA